jgi:4-amino-4-deoxy-L-arabinose transferase-like glycosyltransferase
LWDVDEGTNAETAREMWESGDYVVLRYNFIFRDAKPAMLYWLEAGSYRLFGVNEFAARFPCALATTLNLLLLYELGRALFSPATGLLAGLIHISSILVCLISQMAVPDALLQLFTTLTFYLFWQGYRRSDKGTIPRRWYFLVGIACGLGMLAKGPVALVLPGIVFGVFLLWQRQPRLIWNRRVFLVLLACWLVAAPWYVLETVQTRGWFAKGFFVTNNVNRFFRPMEDHRGPWFYHFVALLVGLAPWCVFLGPVLWFARPFRQYQADAESSPDHRPALRFLWCWIVAYFLFFSCAATKLPNYLLPLFPALALLTASFLESWRIGNVKLRTSILIVCVTLWASIGLGTMVGFIFAGRSGIVPQALQDMRGWGSIGLILLAGGILAAVQIVRQQRSGAVILVVSSALVFLGAIGAGLLPALDAFNAPRQLVTQAGALNRHEEIRLASFHYTRPSLVFYNQREVHQLDSEDEVESFLAYPVPVYLFIAETDWQTAKQNRPEMRASVVARAWDIQRNCNALVISNRAEGTSNNKQFAVDLGR